MQEFYTQAGRELADEALDLAFCGDRPPLELCEYRNESGTARLVCSENDVIDYERDRPGSVDADILPDAIFDDLVGWLRDQIGLLPEPVPADVAEPTRRLLEALRRANIAINELLCDSNDEEHDALCELIEAIESTNHAGTLAQIREVLWPGNDPDAEWDADTTDSIAQVLIAAGFGPAVKDGAQ